MPYCHNCRRLYREIENFCSGCGTNLKEIAEDIGETVEEVVEKTGHKGIFFFIVLLLIIGYVILDIWAISQLTPVISLGSVFASISNLNADIGLTQTNLGSSIRIENPTFQIR